jgi:hypothetical protein
VSHLDQIIIRNGGLGNIGSGSSGNLGNIGGIGDIGSVLNGGSFEDIIFNAAYMYASNDPKYAVVLQALNIHSGADLKKFLMGDKNGSNAQDIVNHLSFEYAKDNPAFADWLTKVGVKDEPSLKAFRNGKGAKYKSTLDKMALVQARSDNNYQQWLDQFGIENVSDLQGLLSGNNSGDLLQKLWPMAKQMIEQKYPQYAQYIPLIESLLGLSSDTSGDEVVIDDPTVDEDNPPTDDFEEVDPPVIEGAYAGIPAKEIKVIQKAKVRKAPKNTSLLD